MQATRISATVLVLLVIAATLHAQVLTVYDVKDPAARRLQQRYMQQLESIGSEAGAHQYPYKFYISRLLDIDELQQQKAEQRSIRFEKYNGHVFLEITGNYYAAYSDSLMDKRARAKKTYQGVVLPLLKIAVPKFAADDSFAGFAIEVSHHVRRRVMSVETENAENLVFVLSREAAHHLVAAVNEEQQQSALLDSEIYLDAEPFLLWLNGEPPAELPAKKAASSKVQVASLSAPPMPEVRTTSSETTASSQTLVSPSVMGSKLPVRLITPDTITRLASTHRETVARMTSYLAEQAHFVPYAPPMFIAFHQAAYLQLPITSVLPTSNGSRYQLAALAFDDHIVHLVRPVLAYFPQDGGFDGLSFSTTLKLPAGNNSEAVEFFFPFTVLRCFANYDCTGQQLIDAGIVLINGERVGLNLTAAEAVTRP